MADVLVEKQYIQDIADSIRLKSKTQDKYKPGQMDEAIQEIETGTDTTDATAEALDIISPKTAYVKGVKLRGKMTMTTRTSQHAEVVVTDYTLDFTPTYTCLTPDERYIISTSASNHIALTNIETGNTVYYNLNDFGLPVGSTTAYGTTSVDICNIPNDKGQYLVVFMNRNGYSASTVHNGCCTYYYEGELGNVQNDNNIYKTFTKISDWGRGTVICSKTQPNKFIIITAKGSAGNDSVVCTVDNALSSITDVSLGNRDGQYSYQYVKGKLSSDDRYLHLLNKDASNTQSFFVLNDNLTTKSLETYENSLEPEFFEEDNIQYMLYNNNFYKLNYNPDTGIYTKTQLNNSNVFSNDIREIAHTNDIIVTSTNDNKYKIFTYNIDENTGITFTLIQTIDTIISYCNCYQRITSYGNTLALVSGNNTISIVSVTGIGEKVPVRIKRASHILYNTEDADITADYVLKDKIAYGKNGQVIGTLYAKDAYNVPVWYMDTYTTITESFNSFLQNKTPFTINWRKFLQPGETIDKYRLDLFNISRTDIQIGDLIFLDNRGLFYDTPEGESFVIYAEVLDILSITPESDTRFTNYEISVRFYEGFYRTTLNTCINLRPEIIKKDENVFGVNGTLDVPSGNTLNEPQYGWILTDRSEIPNVGDTHIVYDSNSMYNVGDIYVYANIDNRAGSQYFKGSICGKIIAKEYTQSLNQYKYTIQVLNVFTREVADIRSTVCGKTADVNWQPGTSTSEQLDTWDSFVPKPSDILIMTDANEKYIFIVDVNSVDNVQRNFSLTVRYKYYLNNGPITQQEYEDALDTSEQILGV